MVYAAAADGAAAGVVWLGELPFEAVSNKVYLGANRREAAEAGSSRQEGGWLRWGAWGFDKLVCYTP